MRGPLRACHRLVGQLVGTHLRRVFNGVRGVSRYVSDVRTYSRLNNRSAFRIHFNDLYPIYHERFESAGTAKGDYFHQDLWAAKRIFGGQPASHVDIGSRIDGFVAHLLVFMPVTLVDIRPLHSTSKGLNFVQDDATTMQTFPDDSVSSLSSLHVAEHFGLGRYSDPIDPDATFSFMRSLQRVLQPGGVLYFSVPIGRERVEFNAHRVFAPETILSTFNQLSLARFCFVDSGGDLHEDVNLAAMPDMEYGCGLFEFTKAYPAAA